MHYIEIRKRDSSSAPEPKVIMLKTENLVSKNILIMCLSLWNKLARNEVKLTLSFYRQFLRKV